MIATFETDHPYDNDQTIMLDITCDSTHNVAYLIKDFNTESGYDFVTLTDLANNDHIFRELKKTNKFCLSSKQ